MVKVYNQITLMVAKETIGIIGGTGQEGQGLALRLGLAGFQIIIGSRTIDKGNKAVEKLLTLAPGLSICIKDNISVSKQADIVIISVPFEAHKDTLEPLAILLAGKIVINVVVPLKFHNGIAYPLHLEEGSAAVQSQTLLPESKIVGAFHNVSSHHLMNPSHPVDCDVIVCSDDEDAKTKVCQLAEQIEGIKAIDGGPLANAQFSEQLTALLININRIHHSSAMIRLTGLPK